MIIGQWSAVKPGWTSFKMAIFCFVWDLSALNEWGIYPPTNYVSLRSNAFLRFQED